MSVHAIEATLVHHQFRAADLLKGKPAGQQPKHRREDALSLTEAFNAIERRAPDMSFEPRKDLGVYFLVFIGIALALLGGGLAWELLVSGRESGPLTWTAVIAMVLLGNLIFEIMRIRRDLRGDKDSHPRQ